MSELSANSVEPERVRRYVEQGPPAFAPGHAGMLQMISVLLAERTPANSYFLLVDAGGELEIRYLAGVEPDWRFVRVDPASVMLDLARANAGGAAHDGLQPIER